MNLPRIKRELLESKFRPTFVVRGHLTNYSFVNLQLFVNQYLYYINIYCSIQKNINSNRPITIHVKLIIFSNKVST